MKTKMDYRDYLRNALSIRCQENPLYSMSAFARDLGLSPARLSEVFRQKQGLSRSVGQRIAKIIQLNDRETNYFCDLIEAEHGRSLEKREMAKLRLQERELEDDYKTLHVDAFNAISDWYHFALVQMTELPFFREDHRWIASSLNITAPEVDAAIERLLRLDTLKRDLNGNLMRGEPFVGTTDGIPSEAIRKFHEQILARAQSAQKFQTAEARSYSANFLTINRKDLTRAKDSLKRFRRRFVRDLEVENNDKEAVFCLGIQFFELTDFKRDN